MTKEIFAAFAFLATLSACTKDTDFDVNSDIKVPEGNIHITQTFTATMEGSPESKATFESNIPSWEEDDLLSINGFYYKAQSAGYTTLFKEDPEIRPSYVSSADKGSYQNQPALNLVDSEGIRTRWIANKNQMNNGVWNIVVSTGNSTLLKTIKLWNAENQKYPNRRWKAIKVYGSASLEYKWEEIKSFSELNLAINNYGLAGEIEVNSTKDYVFYRIDVLDNEGDDYMQMSDMKFVVTSYIRPIYISSTDNGSYQNNSAFNLVDDKGTSTRWCAHKDNKVDGVWNIVVSTGYSTILRSIRLWNAENTANYPKRVWKSIDIYGSTSTEGEWEAIKSFDNLNLVANDADLAGEIAINATKDYVFYKIDILDNEGDNYIQMSDMKFAVSQGSGPYHAYFPANLLKGFSASLPSKINETWSDGKFNMPMYAQSNTTNLHFKNLCGILKIIVKSDQIASVKSIRISSANKATSGDFTVVDNTAVLTAPESKNNTITITYTNAVTTTAEGRVFYVAIPTQTYQELEIELSADGIDFNKSMTTQSSTDITVKRNTIYPIAFVHNFPGPEFVDLGLSVKWAAYNLGATKPEETGGYYQWAGTKDVSKEYLTYSNCPYHTTSHSKAASGWTKYITNPSFWSGEGEPDYKEILDPEDDAAHVALKGSWHIPTSKQWSELKGGCTWTFTSINNISGYKIQSNRRGYEGKWIFIPAVGYRHLNLIAGYGRDAYYWTNNLCTSSPASAIIHQCGYGPIDISRYTGLPIRPVSE